MNIEIDNNDSANEALRFKIDMLNAQKEGIMQSEQIYKTVLNMSEDVFVYEDCISGNLVASDRVFNFFNISKETQISKKLLLNQSRDDDINKVNAIFNSNETKDENIDFMLNDEKTHIHMKKRANLSSEGKVEGKIYYFRNITNITKKNDELKYMAFYDSVTGLYNRNYFIQELSKYISLAEKEKNTLIMMYIDIDDFKHINDTMGIVSGDEVVQLFAAEIKELLGRDMFASRVNNDEFCMAVYNPIGERSFESINAKIKDRLERPFKLINQTEVKLTLSIGVAEYPEAGINALELMKNAEIAMLNVKRKGKNSSGYFDSDMYQEFLREINLEKQLNEAIEDEKFILKYQPQYDIETNKLRGVEALIRWVGNDGKVISPTEFIPLAEKKGRIIKIGDWVMDKAISTLARWQKEYGFQGVMSINISTLQIRKEDFVRKLKTTIDKYNVNPEDVEIEITESVLIDDLQGVISKINKIRAYGIRVSLDDFGVGYSSLSYLKDIPIDTLKIDKSFIDDVLLDKSTNIITKSVIEMVKNLGVETVAEGVENKDQLEYLKKMKCDNIQGFFLGKPMTSEEMEDMFSSSK